MLVNDEYKIIYFPIPKCASTSIKNFFCELTDDPKAKGKSVHKAYPSKSRKKVIKRWKPRYNDYYKFCVIRHPVDRILSCYTNRVLYHGNLYTDKNFRHNYPHANLYPTIEEFIKNIGLYRNNRSILHHTRQLQFYLGKNPELYDDIFKMSQVTPLLIPKLETKFGKKIRSKKVQQKSVKKIRRSDVAPELIRKIERMYAKEINIFNKYY